MYDKASELCNNFLGIYYYKYYELSDDKRNKIEAKHDPKDLFLDEYDYIVWSEYSKQVNKI